MLGLLSQHSPAAHILGAQLQCLPAMPGTSWLGWHDQLAGSYILRPTRGCHEVNIYWLAGCCCTQCPYRAARLHMCQLQVKVLLPRPAGPHNARAGP